MSGITIAAPAKINLGLDVIRRRPDGYHEVRMIMQMLDLHDTVSMEITSEPGIHLTMDLPDLPTDEGNIAFRAADVMMKRFGIREGVRIHIEKRIPVAAGMAGGSTDCAAVLDGMNSLFKLGLDRQALMDIGVTLGADVPYCLLRQTALSEGIGELLTPLPALPDCPVLIAKPPVSVSTGHVYQSLKLDEIIRHPDIDGMAQALKAGDLHGVTGRLGNVLETVTVKEHPVIEDIKKIMISNGALGALMSGSGPTVFGIYDNEASAKMAYEKLSAQGGPAGQVYLTRPGKNCGF